MPVEFIPQQVLVYINGIGADVTYAGDAPGLTAGLFQINARVPENLFAGSGSMYVSIGNAWSDSVSTALK